MLLITQSSYCSSELEYIIGCKQYFGKSSAWYAYRIKLIAGLNTDIQYCCSQFVHRKFDFTEFSDNLI